MNLAEGISWETWDLNKSVRKISKQGEDCRYIVTDQFTFTNEFNAKVRRGAVITLMPVKGTDEWRLMEFDVR